MLKVAFLWHMHQPYYCDPVTGKMFLPWVRLHCLKDYLDLPCRVGRHDRLKMTFNLVPCLIEQIDLYVQGKTSDRPLDLTRRPAAELSREEKVEIFQTFFAGHPGTMIDPYPRYRRLYRKLIDCSMDAALAARTATTQEIRDLTVWANLVWVDPFFRHQAPFKRLFDKGEKYTEEDKQELIEAQLKIMAEIVPTYRSLMEEGKIEVSFTPYYHPILPLLCDTDSAREALPGIVLPKNRFVHPEDAELHVAKAIAMYRDRFGRDLQGMWPSEGAVSEAALTVLARQGIKWAATDDQVLFGSLAKGGQPTEQASPYVPYQFLTPHGPIHLFFRDHTLSDRIGFVYSGWDEEKAVTDFMDQLHRLADTVGAGNRDVVAPIILDGENCWEYYRNDGDTFLELLFSRLAADPVIETVTMSEAMQKLQPATLKNIQAGSWINHNLRVWIGHPEDNVSWDLLAEARRAFASIKEKRPDFDPVRLAAAEKSLLVAEGSDWNWWYGDEHRGPQNEAFDHIYRAHLMSIYSALSLPIPNALFTPITSGLPETFATEPEGTVTPIIDGGLSHYYEWLGAGRFDCLKAGNAMHRAAPLITQIYYVTDEHYVYLRIDFAAKRFLLDNPAARVKLNMVSPRKGEFLFSADGVQSLPDWAGDKRDILFGAGEIAEIGLKKTVFVPDGKGEIFFRIGIVEEGEVTEIWPQGDPIRLQFAAHGEEIVWDL
ncbi:MAG: glycoside hydrolase family 57 protein [candidate division Zixibacteria bacterium]|nr:glycoside hydrolase family 57 protein [candidate division Zixibacteria bacterium]